MARKFWVEIDEHHPDESWPPDNLERCARELLSRCFQCKQQYVAHFSAPDYTSWVLKFRDAWPWEYFKDEAGWDIENGVCPECQYIMQRLN